MPKASAKAEQDKIAAQVQSMQQELKDLQEALGQLVEAMITQEKPGLKEIKKLQTLKKKAQQTETIGVEVLANKTKKKQTNPRKPRKKAQA